MEKCFDLGKKILVNLTAHSLSLVNAKPETLDERKVDVELDVFETLNGKWNDHIEERDGINYVIRRMNMSFDELHELGTKLSNYFEQNDKLVLIVSLPVLKFLKNEIEFYMRTEFGMECEVVGIVSATKRHIKPPVACLTYFSV